MMLRLAVSTNLMDRLRSIQSMKWYAVSGTPISWYDVGNAAMCRYFEGTYCYTPAHSRGATIQHGCCVPGSCTGSDAVKVVQSNDYCFKKYAMYASVLHGGSMDAVCEPMERELGKTGAWSTIVMFLLFLACIVIASVLKVWCH